MTAALDVCTDEGLRQALLQIRHTRSWDVPVGQALLAEIRRRAARTAAHIATKTGVPNDRSLVDDVVASAWLVAVNHQDKVINAERPWAYLMQSAQRQALAEVRAQHLLTSLTRSAARPGPHSPTSWCASGRPRTTWLSPSGTSRLG